MPAETIFLSFCMISKAFFSCFFVDTWQSNYNIFLATAMARLDQVITNIVDIFLEYADDEGKKKQLNKEELKKVLEQEIQSPELKVRNPTYPTH